MTRKIPIVEGEFYHVYNRGVDKRTTFLDKADYERFLLLLFLCNDTLPVKLRDIGKESPLRSFLRTDREKIVDICAYCLMDNHFHLLVYEKQQEGLSMFMQKLLTAYTMYFNKRYERTGALFQGTYKTSHVDKDSYLSTVFRYIHFNPTKLKVFEDIPEDPRDTIDFLREYRYSSFSDYSGISRPESAILTTPRLNLEV
jgi:putative transposase